jgi:hypothetical protein
MAWSQGPRDFRFNQRALLADRWRRPIRHKSLTAKQLEAARDVYAVLGKHIGPFETFEINFLRELNPDSEVDIWYHLASLYKQYADKHGPLSDVAAHAVFGAVLLLSLGVHDRPKKIPKAMWDELRQTESRPL